MGSYFDGMLRYFEFWGRSTRMQYWMFFLFQSVLVGAGIGIDYKMRGTIGSHWSQMPVTLFMVFIHIVPGVMVQARRLHDIGKSGAWYLLTYVPLGGLVLVYWACRPSDAGPNGYSDPAGDDQAPRPSTTPAGMRMGTAVRPIARGADLADGRFI